MKFFQKIIVAAVLLTSGSAFGQMIASFTPSSPFLAALPGGTTFSGQTFTADIDGTVGLVSVLAQRAGSAPASVTFQLRSVSAGLPTSTILGSVSLSGSGIGSSLQTFSADFSSQSVFLTAGQSYAIVVSGSSIFGLGGVADAYTGGAQVISMNSGSTFSFFPPPRDLSFSVASAAVAVPEPSTYAWAGVLALLGICGRSRIRRVRG